jgi:hypothetical protein
MSYIGNQPPDIGAYDVESFDGGGTSFTLKRSATVSSVLLFIDGVRQTPTDAYTVSGVTLTTTGTTPSGTDNVTVMFMGDVVDIGAPSSDTVSTATIQDDAVTAAKLANSINTEITANTAKVTNATHTGDVTGATALTIAADAVDIAMLSATGTADATTFLRGDNAWAEAGGGKVLQVLMMETTASTTFSSTTYADSNLTLSITPAATSSKILVQWTANASIPNGGQIRGLGFKLLRDATAIYTSGDLRELSCAYPAEVKWRGSWYHLDSPSTTSAITYKVQCASYNSFSVGMPTGSNGAQLLLMEVGA